MEKYSSKLCAVEGSSEGQNVLRLIMFFSGILEVFLVMCYWFERFVGLLWCVCVYVCVCVCVCEVV
jgi:hypothetical protein